MKHIKGYLAILLIAILVFTSLPEFAEAASSSKTVSTQATLKSALSSGKYKKLTINSSKKKTFTLPEGNYSGISLVVSAPKATIVNSGVFKKITVSDAICFNECASGNAITITDSDIKLEISKGADLSSLSLKSDNGAVTLVNNGRIEKASVSGASDLAISQNGKMGRLTVNAPANISVDGDSASKLYMTFKSSAEGANLVTALPVSINTYTNIGITLEKSAGTSKVTMKNDKAGVSIDNNSKKSVTVTDSDGNKRTVRKGKELVTENYAKYLENSKQDSQESSTSSVTPEPAEDTIPDNYSEADATEMPAEDEANSTPAPAEPGPGNLGGSDFSGGDFGGGGFSGGGSTTGGGGFSGGGSSSGGGNTTPVNPKPIQEEEITPTPGTAPAEEDSDVIMVSTLNELQSTLIYCGNNGGGTVVLANDIEVVYYDITVAANTTLVVPEGKVLTFGGGLFRQYIYGTIISSESGIAFSTDNMLDRGICLSYGATWYKGNTTLQVAVSEDYSSSVDALPYIYFGDSNGKLSCECYNKSMLNVILPEDKNIDDLGLDFRNYNSAKLYINGQFYLFDVAGRPVPADTDLISVGVSTIDELITALNYYRYNGGGTVTLADSITVGSNRLIVASNTTLVIPEGKALSFNAGYDINVYGSLISSDNGISINSGNMYLYYGATWRKGDITLQPTVSEEYVISANDAPAVNFKNNVGKLSGYIGKTLLNVTVPEGKVIDDLDIVFESSDFSKIYVNEPYIGPVYCWNALGYLVSSDTDLTEVEVSTDNELETALDYYANNGGGTVTLAEDITVKSGSFTIAANTTLVVPEGIALTLNSGDLQSYGTLISSDSGIRFISNGTLYMYNGAIWHKGDIMLQMTALEGYDTSISSIPYIQIRCYSGEITGSIYDSGILNATIPENKTIYDIGIAFDSNHISKICANERFYCLDASGHLIPTDATSEVTEVSTAAELCEALAYYRNGGNGTVKLVADIPDFSYCIYADANTTLIIPEGIRLTIIDDGMLDVYGTLISSSDNINTYWGVVCLYNNATWYKGDTVLKANASKDNPSIDEYPVAQFWVDDQKLIGYLYQKSTLNVSVPDDKSVDDIRGIFVGDNTSKVIVNGHDYPIRNEIEVSTYREFDTILDFYYYNSNCEGTIILADDIVVASQSIWITSNVTLVVPEGKTFTLDEGSDCTVDGKIISHDNGIAFSSDEISFYSGFVWNKGNITLRGTSPTYNEFVGFYRRGEKLYAYFFGEFMLDISLPEGNTLCDTGITFNSTDFSKIRINGQPVNPFGLPVPSGTNLTAVEVSTPDELNNSLNYYRHTGGGTVTLLNDISVNNIFVSPDTTLIIPTGKTLTITEQTNNIHGTLISDADGIIFSSGSADFCNGATWYRGNAAIKVTTKEGYNPSVDATPYVRIWGGTESLSAVLCGKALLNATLSEDLSTDVIATVFASVENTDATAGVPTENKTSINEGYPGLYDDNGIMTMTWNRLASFVPKKIDGNEIIYSPIWYNVFPNVTGQMVIGSDITINSSAFRYAELSTVVLLDPVSAIGDDAFYGAIISKLVIPSTVTSIGNRALALASDNYIIEYYGIEYTSDMTQELKAAFLAHGVTLPQYQSVF